MAGLAGKVAIVTGASRGIGKGCALELGAAGATVYVTGRTAKEGGAALPGSVASTAEEVDREGGHGIAVRCDHRDDEQVAALFERVASEQGRLDILVNNAFIIVREMTLGLPFWQTPISNWDDMIDVGLRSAYVASWHAAKLMVPHDAGLIANISSSGARQYAWHVVYGVGKCALDRVTADTAVELGPRGVSVVSLWPGLVLTERMTAGAQASTALDFSGAESSRFTGRAIAALAQDPDVQRFNGAALSSRQLAEEYGHFDVDGSLPDGPLAHRPTPENPTDG